MLGALRARGHDVFMDLDGLAAGDFGTRLLDKIAGRDRFVLLLEPGSLDRINDDGDWLHREIWHALQLEREVVPVFGNGFAFTGTLPPTIDRLNTLNGLTVHPDYFEEAMDRLSARFLTLRSGGPAGSAGAKGDRAEPITLIRTLTGHTELVRGVAFAADGAMLASRGSDGTIRIWDPMSGVHRRTIRGHAGHVAAVAFPPYGAGLASAGHDGSARIWDPATGQPRHTLRRHTKSVQALAYSAGGAVLASGSSDHTIRLWDPFDGGDLGALRSHTDEVWGVTFTLGSLLASAGLDGTVRFWNTDEGTSSPMNESIVTYEARTRITECSDLDQLDLWIRWAVTAGSVAELFD